MNQTPVDDDNEPHATSGEKDAPPSVVGGFAFFLSLTLLFPTGFLFFVLAVALLRTSDPKLAVAFLGSCLFGALLSHAMIRGHISVLLHEFKHALVSNLVGNKNKKMQVSKNSGHLVYSYTKKTAHYNAFISLAPYIVPVCTFVGILLSIAVTGGDPLISLIIIGLAYGADLLLNTRDISPVQTDITLIRGGYGVGIMYILAWNLFIAAFVLAWAFQGAAGVAALFSAVSRVFFALYFWITGATPSG